MLEEQPDPNSQNPYTTSVAREIPANKRKLCGPSLWMRFKCLKVTEPLQGDSLFFTSKSPGVPGTYLIDLGRMKG